MKTLSTEEVDNLMEITNKIFDIYDDDHSGGLSRSEFTPAINGLLQ